jgi:hypothetical protein
MTKEEKNMSKKKEAVDGEFEEVGVNPPVQSIVNLRDFVIIVDMLNVALNKDVYSTIEQVAVRDMMKKLIEFYNSATVAKQESEEKEENVAVDTTMNEGETSTE